MTVVRLPAHVALAIGALIATDLMVPHVNLVTPAPAHAVVGRPATPISVAGVARRTTRRAVVATSATVAATTPAPAPTVVVVEPPPPQQAPQ